MTTINLRDGLEALYYFGEQDFNPQRNQLQDHSGYGRHATAIGGPTVGVNGPNDFEAASFDGSDDKFNSPAFNNGQVEEATYCFLFGGSNPEGGIFSLGYEKVRFFDDGNAIKWEHRNGFGGNRLGPVKEGIPNPPLLVTGTWNRGTLSVFFDTNLVFRSTTATSTTAKLSGGATIGEFTNKNKHFNGIMSMFGLWTRELSDAEIEYLNRLTAPRRAQL